MMTHSKMHPYFFAGLKRDRQQDVAYKKRPSIREIIEAVSHVHDISIEDMKKMTRRREIVRARQHAYYLMRKLSGCTFQLCADQFGKDHATVMYGIKVWENELRYNDTMTLHGKVLERLLPHINKP